MEKNPHFAGLSWAEVQNRQVEGLTNTQVSRTSRTISNIVFANLFTLFNAVVGGSFLLLLILGQWRDALFGLAVVMNISIGITQELLARRSLDRLSLINMAPVRVIRNSENVEISNNEVVLGDLLDLKPGDVIPADSKLLQTQELEVDLSILTGESEPASRSAGETIFSGSSIVAGVGIAEVIRVGESNYANKLVSEIRRYQLVNSEIRNSLNRVVKWISWLLIPIIIIASFGQMSAETDLVDGLVATIAGVISMVPQGLVLMTSIAFAVAATTLAGKKVLLQELAAVEILARVDVVCFDKTGTLTKGSMAFHSEFLLEPHGEPILDWKSVLGHFANDPKANATAQALKQDFRIDPSLEEIAAVPFSSSRKWSSFSFSSSAKGTESWVLGAPEFVLEPNKRNRKALNQSEALASSGQRTLILGFSKKIISGKKLPKDIYPVVILCFREELVPSISETLTYLKTQNVKVKILSGDNPKTVAMVAKDAGFGVKGVGFDARGLPLNPLEQARVIEEEVILGRVTPDQKKLIVKSLQLSGHVVAMIGDGVNDALALKQSDLGIAMGSGAASTKQVANLVLVDNNFNTLPSVINEGRKVIANIERISMLFLTKTVWALILTLVFGLLLWKFPFLPRQVAAIDAFTIGIPAFLLALLPNSSRYRSGFLERSLKFCIPSGVSIGFLVIALVFVLDRWTQVSESQSQTAVSLLLALTGLWVLSILMRPFNAVKILILISMVIIGVFLLTVPFLLSFFAFSYLGVAELSLVLFFAGLAAIATELSNRYSRNSKPVIP